MTIGSKLWRIEMRQIYIVVYLSLYSIGSLLESYVRIKNIVDIGVHSFRKTSNNNID